MINDKLRQDMIYFLGQLESLRFLAVDNSAGQFVESLSEQYKAILYGLLGTHFE